MDLQRILAGRDILKDIVQMNIGDGRSTLIWHDSWIPSVTDFCVVRPLHFPLHINLVAVLVNQSSMNWNHRLVHYLFS